MKSEERISLKQQVTGTSGLRGPLTTCRLSPRHRSLVKLVPLLTLFLTAVLYGKVPDRTCRILFLAGPPDAPRTLQLFDGKESREVELPRMNFSPVYELPAGALKLYLLPIAPADPSRIPAEAPATTVPEGVTDFYLIVSSDPGNTVAPVRLQIVNVGEDRLKRGQMLWLNLTSNVVGGTLGSRSLLIASGARAVLEAPVDGNEEYPVSLSFRIPGNEQLYPLCETRWRHDPRSREVVFILPQDGRRSPRVIGFSDYRELPSTKR